MNITTTLRGKNTYTTAIRILMVIAIVLGTFPFTISSAASSVLIDAHFDSGQDGFSYADDTFRGTNQPSYASGSWGSGYGYSGGGLRVYLGAVNTNTINGMSGGWSETFNLSSPDTVTISFRYRLSIASEYESDEYGQALFSLDGALQGNSSNDYLSQIYGNGNGGSTDTTGWQQYTGQFSLSTGDHTITIGGYNNKKTYNNEWVEVLVDDVNVTAGNAVPYADAGQDQSIQDADQDGFELVNLDGSGSYDLDGTIVSYEWTEGGLPLASGITPVVSLALGTHTITLTVVDDEGEMDTDQVEISITEPPQAQAIVDRLDYGNFKAVIKSLNDFGDRCQMTGCSLTSYNNAQAWLEGQLSAMGYTVERHYYSYNSTTRASTYVTKVGTVRPDQMYMVACHLDGRGGGGAADDNGSGCALLFEGARVFAQPDVETDISIRFLFWGNEESGLNGSTSYRTDRYALQGIENPPGSGLYPEPTWLGNITHDMILYDHGVPAQSQQIAAADIDVEYRDGTTYEAQSRDLALYLQGANERYSTGIPTSPRHYPVEVNDYSTNTDDTPYHNYCPAISVRENRRLDEISGVHPYYHTSKDIYENYSELDFQLGFNTVQMTIGAVAELAGAHIISSNNPPAAESQSITLDEDTSISVTLTGSDPDNDPLSYSVTTLPSNGNLVGSPPDLVYTPNLNFNGADTFQFVVNDGSVNSSSAAVSITVYPINDPPSANSQSVSTSENTPLSITLSGSDVDSDPLSYIVMSSPVNGSLSGTAPYLSYTPNVGFSGMDNFTFKVNDGTVDSGVAAVNITISAVNDPPTADDQSVSTNEETATAITLTGSDPENDPLTFNVTGGPSNGSLSGTAPDLTYSPDTDFNGSDSFTFVTNDGEFDSPPATVSITVNPVNDPPEANPQSVNTDEDVPTAILLTGSDVENDPLTYLILQGPANGSLSGTAPDLTYTPDGNYNGADSFTFIVNDGTVDSAIGAVSITVDPVNDKPEAAAQSLSTEEDISLPVTLSGTDIDGDGLTYSVTTAPSSGSLSGTAPNLVYTPVDDFNGTDSFTFVANDGNVDSDIAVIEITVNPVNDAPAAVSQSITTQQDTAAAITLEGSDIDGDELAFSVGTPPANGTITGTPPILTYTPDAGFIGEDSFTFTAYDGSLASSEAQVDITVTRVNHAPVANSQLAATDEDTPVGITLTGTDSDGDPLSYQVGVQPVHGSLSGTAPNLIYTPDQNYNGTDSFSFIVNDGLVDSDPALVSISITSVNDDPVADSQNLATDEDTILALILTGSDVENDPLVYEIVTPPTSGSLIGTAPNLTYEPNANFSGTDNFTFRVNDGGADSQLAAIQIDIAPVNDQPSAESQSVITSEDTAIGITLVGSDIDGDLLTYSVVNGPSNGSLSGSGGNLTYTPDLDFNGSDSFSFVVNDGSLNSAPATVSITVSPVDDPPVADDQSISTTEDNPLVIVLTGNDVDGDPLSYILVSGPTNGTLSGTEPNLTYTPDGNYNGPDSLTFKVNDGVSDSNIATISIDVTPINDQPLADPQAVTTAEDTSAGIILTGSDIDGDSLTYQVLTDPSNGTLNGSGVNLTYTPNADFNGTDSFTFATNDGTIASAPAAVIITITAVNDQPTADDQTISTLQDTPVDLTLTGSDIEGESLSFSVVTGPVSGVLSGTPPDLTYTPDAGYTGSDSFTFVANDGTADSAVAIVEITITPAGPSVVFEDDFETNKGWICNPNGSDSATTGIWERANPETVDYNGYKQLGNTVSGSYDLVTGPLAGSSAGSYDIDNGVTSIRSPEFTLPAGQDITLSFYYYLAHASNSSSSDFLRVKVVGTSTTLVFEELGAANDDDAVWAQFSGSLNAFGGQTVYLLIEAADASGGSLVEAAVDDVLVMAEPIIPSTTILEATFDSAAEGFVYQDDTFRGTNQPGYASGTYQSTGGYTGGGLRVYLGGVNTSTIYNMSGGWEDTFSLDTPAEVIVSFYYQLKQSSEYESDEYSQALVSLDGVLYGLNGKEYLAQISGDGNGGSEPTTGWNLVELNLGTLSAGEHTLVFGGFNNKKTYNNEWTEILIDSVVVSIR